METFWTQIGEIGHFVVYTSGLSILGVVFQWMAGKAGVVGTIGKALKALVDFFSANIKHPA